MSKKTAPAAAPARQESPELTAPTADDFIDFPDDAREILERRLLAPELPGSLPIRLRDEPAGKPRRWYLRWVNTSIPNRFHVAIKGLGYARVRWTELQSLDDVSDRFAGSQEFVARGDRGVEVLVKMPVEYYKRIKARQQELRDKRERPSQMKADLQRAAAARASEEPDLKTSGDEAAALVGGFVGDIKVGRERLVSSQD